MPWLPSEHMADVHVIRQDYAQALAALQAGHTRETAAAYDEVVGRRDRAIRSLHRDDNASVRHLAAMFRCSKTTIRDVLAQGEE